MRSTEPSRANPDDPPSLRGTLQIVPAARRGSHDDADVILGGGVLPRMHDKHRKGPLANGFPRRRGRLHHVTLHSLSLSRLSDCLVVRCVPYLYVGSAYWRALLMAHYQRAEFRASDYRTSRLLSLMLGSSGVGTAGQHCLPRHVKNTAHFFGFELQEPSTKPSQSVKKGQKNFLQMGFTWATKPRTILL